MRTSERTWEGRNLKSRSFWRKERLNSRLVWFAGSFISWGQLWNCASVSCVCDVTRHRGRQPSGIQRQNLCGEPRPGCPVLAAGKVGGVWSGRRKKGVTLAGVSSDPAMCLQTADQLLARADAAKALAEEAAKKGRNTLQEANDILNNLKGMKDSHSSVSFCVFFTKAISLFFFKFLPWDSQNIHRMKSESVTDPLNLSSSSTGNDFYYMNSLISSPQHAPSFFLYWGISKKYPRAHVILPLCTSVWK